MLTSVFWRDAAERAIRTAAQSAIGVLGAGAVGVLDVDWANTGSVAGLAAVVSVLMSIAASRTDDPTSASFLPDR